MRKEACIKVTFIHTQKTRGYREFVYLLNNVKSSEQSLTNDQILYIRIIFFILLEERLSFFSSQFVHTL